MKEVSLNLGEKREIGFGALRLGVSSEELISVVRLLLRYNAIRPLSFICCVTEDRVEVQCGLPVSRAEMCNRAKGRRTHRKSLKRTF